MLEEMSAIAPSIPVSPHLPPPPSPFPEQMIVPQASEWNDESREETLARLRAKAATAQPPAVSPPVRPEPIHENIVVTAQPLVEQKPKERPPEKLSSPELKKPVAAAAYVAPPSPKPVEPPIERPVYVPPAPQVFERPVVMPPPPEPIPSPVEQPLERSFPLREPEVSPLEAPASIHTYSEDFTDRVRDTRASTATVLAAEQDAGQGATAPLEEGTPHKLVFVVLGMLLLVLGAGGMYYAYTLYSSKHDAVIIAPTVSAPIVVDDRVEIAGEGLALLRAVEQSVSQPLPVGAIRLLYSTSATTTEQSVFATMQYSAPGVLTRNINGDASMAGIVNVGGTQSPFFILSVNSYNDTFAGMLSWERTMPSDLGALFPAYPEPVPVVVAPVQVATTSLATSTPATSTPKGTAQKPAAKKVVPPKSVPQVVTAAPPPAPAPVFIPAFHDEVVINHDVRVYRDALGRSLLLYSYWNATTLVIARDPEAFAAILARLASSHTQ